jgi:CheY-like chemotaxis protein
MRYADALLILTIYLSDNGSTAAEINRLSKLSQLPGKKVDEDVNYIPYSLIWRRLLEMKGTMECSVDMSRSRISLMIPQRVVDNAPYGGEQPPSIAELREKAQRQLAKEAHEAETALAQQEEPEAPQQAQPEPAAERQHTVMVVDDNLLYLKEMDNWLRKMNLKTVMAKSGRECLRILERKPVDLIFMDQMMPEMDGTQALQEIRKLEKVESRPNVPVVVLTADDSTGAKERYLKLGFDDYLAKPIEARQIREQVKRYLNV